MAIKSPCLEEMSPDEFAEIVEADIRNELDDDTAEALRSPECSDRWYHALVAIKKRVETSLGSRRSHLSGSLETLPTEKARTELARFHSWRGNTMTFLRHVEERIQEARDIRSLHHQASFSMFLTQERDIMVEAYRNVLHEVERHRERLLSDDGLEPSPADIELWKILDQEKKGA